jgi:hypothetical protein
MGNLPAMRVALVYEVKATSARKKRRGGIRFQDSGFRD